MYRIANPTLRNCLMFLPVPVPPQKNAICLRCFLWGAELGELDEGRDPGRASKAACVTARSTVWLCVEGPWPPGREIKFS